MQMMQSLLCLRGLSILFRVDGKPASALETQFGIAKITRDQKHSGQKI